ncbi:MAG: hypothetical protein ACI8S6_002790 [Myxococcota bacterium]|jgi:hypothetical protein
MSHGDAHNHLFRFAFARVEVAREHFRAHLLRPVVDSIDWGQLTHKASSFIDPGLRRSESDLLYRAPLHIGGSACLYLLFEHQRSLDYRMPFRLLQYMVRIWSRELARHGSPRRRPQLPLIVPMVLYNGTQRWTVSTRFADLFPQDELFSALSEHVPDFRYIIHDLSQIPEEAIRGAALGRLIQLLLKWADSDDFWERFPDWLETMRGILLQPELGMDAIEAMLRYIMSVASGLPPESIRPGLRHFLTPTS